MLNRHTRSHRARRSQSAALPTALSLALLVMTTPANATWSIVVVDTKTREVGVASATCLTSFDLQAGLPMMLVDVGGAAAQSLVDVGAVNRMLIAQQMAQGRSPERILSMISQADPNYQSRQFGIVDVRGRSATFTGLSAGQYRGGLTGSVGDLVYAIQGNVLTGQPVLTLAEQALRDTPGDIPAKLMAAMEAARAMGGDGRCSCLPTNPTACGSPPFSFEKSSHIAFMILSRTGDTDGVCNGALGCANGDYFMDFNVPFQPPEAEDPVLQLHTAFNAWRASLLMSADAVQSEATIAPESFKADEGGEAILTIRLRNWQGAALSDLVPAQPNVAVQHDARSAGLSQIGPVVREPDGSMTIALTVLPGIGVDRFRVVVDDSVRTVILLPMPELHHFALSDIDRDDDVDLADSFAMFNCLAGPDEALTAQCAVRDTDGDKDVDLEDAARHFREFTAPPCGDLFIYLHPETQTVRCGLSFTLNVAADADPPPYYQWYHNGQPITGATNPSYQVAVSTSADLGEYFVRLANSCGTAFSNTAHLTPRGSCP